MKSSLEDVEKYTVRNTYENFNPGILSLGTPALLDDNKNKCGSTARNPLGWA